MKKGLALSMPKGFTLIELLIVIAVLGVLAAGVLVAINPGEQLARARDASRKTTIGQLSKAVQAYYTSRGNYPAAPADGTWISVLVNAGEVKSVPGAISYQSGIALCTLNPHNGFCYGYNYPVTGVDEATVYTKLESKSEGAKCPGNSTYFVWSSKAGKTGIVCTNAEGSSLRPDIDITFEL